MKSNFPKLKIQATPINKQTAIVGFAKGEDYIPKNVDHRLLDGRKKPRSTHAPESKLVTNFVTENFEGVKYGRLTCLWLHRIGRNNDYWVMRCDCGMYQTMAPSKLIKRLEFGLQGSPKGIKEQELMCDHCKIANQANLSKTFRFDYAMPKQTRDSARILIWIEHLRKEGFLENEIEFIVRSNYSVQKNLTVSEVREELRNIGFSN
jgi:hypothetical protein